LDQLPGHVKTQLGVGDELTAEIDDDSMNFAREPEWSFVVRNYW